MLDYNAYLKLEAAVDEYVSCYRSIKHIDCPIHDLHLCFILDKYNSFPTLTFHFENADLKLEVENVFIIDYVLNFFGLAISPVHGKNILGAFQCSTPDLFSVLFQRQCHLSVQIAVRI